MERFIVVSMKTFEVLGRFDEEAAADAAHEANAPAHTVKDGDLSALATTDLVRLYNAFPGVKAVARFSDRKAAERRVLEKLSGVQPPEISPSAATAAEEPQPPTEEPKTMATKKPKKKASPRRTNGADVSVQLAAAGRKEGIRFQTDSPRSKVFSIIKKEGEIALDALVKKCSFITRAQVMGCLTKLKASGYIKVVHNTAS